jgi:hypothetical protein
MAAGRGGLTLARPDTSVDAPKATRSVHFVKFRRSKEAAVLCFLFVYLSYSEKLYRILKIGLSPATLCRI